MYPSCLADVWLFSSNFFQFWVAHLFLSLSKWRCFPGSSESKEFTWDMGDLSSIPGVGKIPWRREWQPTPIFLPGESHGQRNLADDPWGCIESDTTERWHCLPRQMEDLLLWFSVTSQIKKQKVLPGLVGAENRKRHVWEPRRLILHALCPLEPVNYELLLPCLFHPHFFFFSFYRPVFPAYQLSFCSSGFTGPQGPLPVPGERGRVIETPRRSVVCSQERGRQAKIPISAGS